MVNGISQWVKCVDSVRCSQLGSQTVCGAASWEVRQLSFLSLPSAGTASLDPRCNGKVSAVALTYIIVTNSIPCFVAIAMAFAIRPGGFEIRSALKQTMTSSSV